MSKAVPTPKRGLSRNMIKYITIGIVVIAAIVAVALANRVPQSAQSPAAQSTLKIGDKAPDFSIGTNAGPFSLAAQPVPVFLEVFATWCPHCQREVPIIDALAKKYAGKISFIGISGSPFGVDGSSPENQADINAWIDNLKVTYPIAFDPDQKTANLFLQGGFPTIVIMDKGKIVRYVGSGELPPSKLTQEIDSVLSSHS